MTGRNFPTCGSLLPSTASPLGAGPGLSSSSGKFSKREIGNELILNRAAPRPQEPQHPFFGLCDHVDNLTRVVNALNAKLATLQGELTALKAMMAGRN